MLSLRHFVLVCLASLVAAVPIMIKRAEGTHGSMWPSVFGQQTGCPDLSQHIKDTLLTKSYAGVFHARSRGQCGKWIVLKQGDKKAIRARIIDSTNQDENNILGSYRVFERFGLEPAGKVEDVQWALCNSYNRDDCPTLD